MLLRLTTSRDREQTVGVQGFFRMSTDWTPILRGLVSGAYALPALMAANLVFLRRDVSGG
jgi:hypothetical protein